jgi:hypothetical protein
MIRTRINVYRYNGMIKAAPALDERVSFANFFSREKKLAARFRGVHGRWTSIHGLRGPTASCRTGYHALLRGKKIQVPVLHWDNCFNGNL